MEDMLRDSFKNRRYQVFVSSTYEDLEAERTEAIQALLELDCLPAGMELFPAANEQQWTWIKKIIDESDYYIVIVAGRYGSLNQERGISYTEMEYRYALESGKPILAFLHEDPSLIPSGKSESDIEGREKLLVFRQLCEKKLCKYWEGPADLAAKISRGLTQLIKHEPSAGWIRADETNAGQELEILRLRAENKELRDRIKSISRTDVDPTSLASGSDVYELGFVCSIQQQRINKAGNKYWVQGEDIWHRIEITWDQIFYSIIPALTTTRAQEHVYRSLIKTIENRVSESDLGLSEENRIQTIRIRSQCGDQIRMQFTALSLIEVEVVDYKIFWMPTEKGMSKIVSMGALSKGERRARKIEDFGGIKDSTQADELPDRDH